MKNNNALQALVLTGMVLLQLTTLCFHTAGAAGDVDLSFDPGLGVNGPVTVVAVQPDGKVLLGGLFTFINGMNQYGSYRLNADGSLDNTFTRRTLDLSPANSASYSHFPTAVAVGTDGKIVVGESVLMGTHCDPTGCNYFYGYYITRLSADESHDTNFAPVVRILPYGEGGEGVTALAVQANGSVVVGGTFHSMLGTARAGIARLKANGSLDGGFHPVAGIGYDYGLTAIVIQPDGKLLLASKNLRGDCDEASCDLVSDFTITRLNADGTVDSAFNPATGSGIAEFSSDGNTSIAVQSDGKILIGGNFSTVNGTNRSGIARLNANGSLDPSFNPGTGANGNVSSLALQSDGKLLIGGAFTAVNGAVRPYVARLWGDAPYLSITRSNGSAIVFWPASAVNFQLQENTNLSLPNAWSLVAQPLVTNGAQLSVSVPAGNGTKFFRLKSR